MSGRLVESIGPNLHCSLPFGPISSNLPPDLNESDPFNLNPIIMQVIGSSSFSSLPSSRNMSLVQDKHQNSSSRQSMPRISHPGVKRSGSSINDDGLARLKRSHVLASHHRDSDLSKSLCLDSFASHHELLSLELSWSGERPGSLSTENFGFPAGSPNSLPLRNKMRW